MKERWYVYVVECGDGSLYTGIAKDIELRVAMHNEGKGAKYTRGRGPVRVVGASPPMGRGPALQLEAAVKKLKGEKKLGALARGGRKIARSPASPRTSAKCGSVGGRKIAPSSASRRARRIKTLLGRSNVSRAAKPKRAPR